MRIACFLGASGTLAFVLARGPRPGIGFLCGAVLSILNLRWWSRLVDSLGRSEDDPAKVPSRASVGMLIRRYVLAGVAIYVIVKILESALVAVLAGLFVTVAAVILEILYEVLFRR
jgi:ATP synthase I subunit